MEGSPLGHVNAYLLDTVDGYALVDCGWEGDDVMAALEVGLRQLGVRLADVRTLVVTHRHADHYGLAATLVQRSTMRLLMHRLEWDYLERHFRDMGELERDRRDWLARNGFTRGTSTSAEIAFTRSQRLTLVGPDGDLEDGQTLGAGGRAWQVVWTPGHTPGHVCLYSAASGAMLTGDHVLEPITPNVSAWLPDIVDPLGRFIASLRKVAQLPADLVLPAHGAPFRGLTRRVGELLDHHAARERAVSEALDGRLMTATDVARALPWTHHARPFDELRHSQQRMAVTETLSHLELLCDKGRAIRQDEAGRIGYRPAAHP